MAVMFFYSPLLTFIVLGVLSILHRHFRNRDADLPTRLDLKFARGAENQAFLVESITGVETLKAMAVEPQMQRRWEEQLAGYVSASFRVISLGNYASSSVHLVSNLVNAAILYLRRKTRDRWSAHGRRTRRIQHAWPVVSARLCCAWRKSGRISIRRDCPLRDLAISSTRRLNRPTIPARASLPADPGDVVFEHVSFRYRIDGPEILHDVNSAFRRGKSSRWSGHRALERVPFRS